MGVLMSKPEHFAREPCVDFDSGNNTPYSLALRDKFPEVIQQLAKYQTEISHFYQIVSKTNMVYKNMAHQYERISNIKVLERVG